MKNIERIIKYLSEEMHSEEKAKFLVEISNDSELRDELESLTLIWDEIKEQLTLSEAPESSDREAIIAEVMAEHDLQFYKQEPVTKKEQEFIKKLEEILNEDPAAHPEKRRINPKILSIISMAAAAAIIAFILILLPPAGIDELAVRYYQPASDEVFESVNITSRSGEGTAMSLFRQGNFEMARSVSFTEMQKNPGTGEIRLLYALACYELGDQKAAEANLHVVMQRFEGQLNETARWYLALILIRSDQAAEASQLLEDLALEDGQYSDKASKLHKKLK